MERNVLNVYCSKYSNVGDSRGVGIVNLYDWLTETDPSLLARVDRIRDEVRQGADKDTVDRLKEALPCITVSGRFSYRNDSHLLQHTGLYCIDIDRKRGKNREVNMHLTEEQFEERVMQFRKYKQVAYIGKSVSARGFIVIVPISQPECHKEYFAQLEKIFSSKGLIIDGACSDVPRLRIFSYDPHAYFNLAADPLPFVSVPSASTDSTPAKKTLKWKPRKWDSHDQASRVEHLISAIESAGADITNDYQDWIKVGFALASEYREAGRNYFHALSALSGKYTCQEADKQYNKCLRTNYNGSPVGIGTLFHLAKSHGIHVPQQYSTP